MKTFNVNTDQAARLLMELKQCVKRKNLVSISNFIEILCNFLRKGYIILQCILYSYTRYETLFQITIFRCTDSRDKKIELDEVIMTALFKAQHLSPTEQLSLALAWNRCDIATKEIFTYGKFFFLFLDNAPNYLVWCVILEIQFMLLFYILILLYTF